MMRRTGSAWAAWGGMLGLLWMSIPAARAQSQVDAVKTITQYSNPPGLAAGTPAGSYALGDAESIDYFSGHLNYVLPLLQVGGRGEAGYTVSLKIPSKWEASTDIECHPISEGYSCQARRFMAAFGGHQAAIVGYGPGVVRKRTNATLDTCTMHLSNPAYQTYGEKSTRSTLIFVDSRGTEYELFDKSQYGGDYYTPPVEACAKSDFPPSRGRIFASRDGSAMTFVADDDILDGQSLGTATLFPSAVEGFTSPMGPCTGWILSGGCNTFATALGISPRSNTAGPTTRW